MNAFLNHITNGGEILDYGGGDGILSEVCVGEGFCTTCVDISKKAIDLAIGRSELIQGYQITSIKDVATKGKKYNGILCWGVFHHIDPSQRKEIVSGFYNLLHCHGVVLIGGHSTLDQDFSQGMRISPTAGNTSHAIDALGSILQKCGFNILNEGQFPFIEYNSESQRNFKRSLCKK